MVLGYFSAESKAKRKVRREIKRRERHGRKMTKLGYKLSAAKRREAEAIRKGEIGRVHARIGRLEGPKKSRARGIGGTLWRGLQKVEVRDNPFLMGAPPRKRKGKRKRRSSPQYIWDT